MERTRDHCDLCGRDLDLWNERTLGVRISVHNLLRYSGMWCEQCYRDFGLAGETPPERCEAVEANIRRGLIGR